MATVANTYHTLRHHAQRPYKRQCTKGVAPVILMVSGGADSVALFMMALHEKLDIQDGQGLQLIAKERLHVFHLNHQLRGQDALADELYVKELAKRYGIPCHALRADVAKIAQEEMDGNVENAGRQIRYRLANHLANELCDARGIARQDARILSAHTASDRAETFLMNTIRGSGLTGLSSIPKKRGRVVRPLLSYTHDDLCRYLEEMGIAWCEDATNKDTHYLRSFVRYKVLPVLKEKNPKVVEGIAGLSDILTDEDMYLSGIASQIFKTLIRRQTNHMVALDASRLSATDIAIARRVVKQALLAICPDARIEFQHITQALKLVANQGGSASLCMGIDARVEHGLLFLRTPDDVKEAPSGWLEVPGSFRIDEHTELTARLVQLPRQANPVEVARLHAQEWGQNSVLIDACSVGITSLGGKLWVDTAQPGDVMCPLGMSGQSKKLSDLLCDYKIPAADKSKIPVVRRDLGGNVVWVTGIRVDERVRCYENSKLLIELSIRSR